MPCVPPAGLYLPSVRNGQPFPVLPSLPSFAGVERSCRREVTRWQTFGASRAACIPCHFPFILGFLVRAKSLRHAHNRTETARACIVSKITTDQARRSCRDFSRHPFRDHPATARCIAPSWLACNTILHASSIAVSSVMSSSCAIIPKTILSSQYAAHGLSAPRSRLNCSYGLVGIG